MPDDTPDAVNPEDLLDQHRRDIEALDRRILHLVCERLELARQIGDLLRRSVDEWQSVVEDGDLDRFTEIMNGCRDYLAEVGERAGGSGS